jgi:hypothetical protein
MSAIDFTGPQGAAGADGADGADGAAGPPGTGRYVMQVLVSDPAEDLTAGTGKRYLAIPFALDGKVLVAVQAHLVTAASAGLTSVQIHNVTDAVNVLSTVCSIDATHKDSKTATTAAVINTANDDMADGDELRIDVPAAGSGAKGLVVSLSFEGASGVSGTGGGMFDAYAYLRDEKPANTAGGAATTGSWQTRTLNTEVIDTNAIVALSANQFTLGAGIYVIRARAPCFRTQRSKI